MKLARPSDLPAELAGRYERVAEPLADLDAALPGPLEASGAQVLLTSEFVLRVLLRWPHALLDRLADAQPLEPDAVAPRLKLEGLSEAQAMSLAVNGFINDLVRQFPMEYSVELKRLIDLEMEGSVG